MRSQRYIFAARPVNVSRRGLLTGGAATILAAGTRPSSGKRTPLSLVLKFSDGRSLSFSELAATDIGDYVGPFVHQKCLRQRASGNGDYRDAFLVDFRPDANGSRDEVVIEYGTLYKFGAAGVPPQTASGLTPVHLFMPGKVAVLKTSGGASTQAGNILAAVSYVRPEGEGVATGTGEGIRLAAGDRLTITSPTPMAGATGYNVYAVIWGVTPGSTYIRQNAMPIPFGQNWAAPAEGLLLTGAAPPKAPAWPAYIATISGGNLAAPVTVPVLFHEWGTRWRWQSAPRPIMRTYDDLVAIKAILPMDRKYHGTAPMPAMHSWRGPMDTAGLETAMPAPADRPEIGLLTEQQACYLLTGDAGCRTTIFAQAEATGSMPLWVRDADTGAIVDAGARSYVAFNSADHRYRLPLSPVHPIRTIGHFTCDSAHMPPVSFVPYMLTGDLYHLEGMHAQAAFETMGTNYRRLIEKLPRLGNTSQPRALAWNWREIFRNAMFTPDPAPSWLLSRAQWRAFIADQVTFGQRYIDAKQSPCTTVFKFFPFTNNTEAFMLDYLMLVIGWIRWTRQFTEMNPIIEYAATPRLTMSDPSDKDGWDHRYQMFYYGPVWDARLGAKATGTPNYSHDVPPSPNTPADWKELFTCLRAWAPASHNMRGWVDPANLAPETIAQVQIGYLPLVRGGLAALAQAGLPGAKAAHDWLAGKLNLAAPGAHKGAALKWAIAPPA